MERIVLVTKPTRLDDLVQQHMTKGAVKFFIESQGQSMDSYESEDAAYRTAMDTIRKEIPGDISLAQVSREALPYFLFRDDDLVIVCGPDGLLVNTAQYVGQQMIMGVNPDPRSIAGILMLFAPAQVRETISLILAGKEQVRELPFVKATIDDSQTLWGINDVFIGRRDHASARYSIMFQGGHESQSSSGIVISTGVGSSGWMKSIRTMIAGISGSAGDLDDLHDPEDNELQFIVREPFISPSTGARILTGRIDPELPLKVVSEMPDGGCIFSDGILEKALTWNAGSVVTVTVGERYLNQLVP